MARTEARTLLLSALLITVSLLSSPIHAQKSFPHYIGPVLDPLLPHGGVPLAKNVSYACLYRATLALGTYNMAPMIDFHAGQFLAYWKNAPRDEDQPGQRVLFSQSLDGITWTPTDGKNILFPNMSTASKPAALFAEPTLHINGRFYAGASPNQFCVYPIQSQVPRLGQATLLLRQILAPGLGQFGPVFWATNQVPPGFEEVTALNGVKTLDQMDAQTQSDIATLADFSRLPCPGPGDGSLKCEACLDGCEGPLNRANMTRELTHYPLPGDAGDVLFYRVPTQDKLKLAASVRLRGGNWSAAQITSISDDHANINAGRLPDGRVYLLSNTMPFVYRDPLFLSTSTDGFGWSTLTALTSCEEKVYTAPDQPYGCLFRHQGGAKQSGCEYPQGMSVTAPGKEGFYAIYSLNKEDIYIARVPFSSII